MKSQPRSKEPNDSNLEAGFLKTLEAPRRRRVRSPEPLVSKASSSYQRTASPSHLHPSPVKEGDEGVQDDIEQGLVRTCVP